MVGEDQRSQWEARKWDTSQSHHTPHPQARLWSHVSDQPPCVNRVSPVSLPPNWTSRPANPPGPSHSTRRPCIRTRVRTEDRTRCANHEHQVVCWRSPNGRCLSAEPLVLLLPSHPPQRLLRLHLRQQHCQTPASGRTVSTVS